MKKGIKIIGVVVLIIVSVLIGASYFLESKIDSIVQNYADENLDAKLSFDDINLSLIKSFPKTYISVKNIKIINNAPFENDTLIAAKTISFQTSIIQLLKSGSDDPLIVNEIFADEADITLKINEEGVANYDISKSGKQESSSNENESSFSFDIENYAIENSNFKYIDEASKTVFNLIEFNHNGKGIFSADKSELDTHTDTKIILSVDSTNYLNNHTIKLDALIDLDLESNTYTFKDNKGYINALPLEFNGFIQLIDKGQLIDLNFKNPESSFKDFLAVLPEVYSKNIDNVETQGNFTVNGIIKGLVSEHTIPTLDINMRSNNAAFKYSDLPKRVDNITINASIKNKTGNPDDTYVDINTLNFKIDEDVFKSDVHIKNLTENILINANIDGILNLANVCKAYPIPLENQLSGILKGQLSTSFDMAAIETNAYQRIKNRGSVSISDFVFSSEDIVNPIEIKNADLTFKSGTVTVNDFNALSGSSDFGATGSIQNLLGFLLSDKKLQGDFNINSNRFSISDFMVEDTTNDLSNKTTSEKESLKIPGFLDCNINANVKEVIYDDITLKNVKGQLRIKDQNAKLINMTSDLFNGQLGISGNVSTKNTIPLFDMKLGMNQLDISESFNKLELLKTLAPIANVLQGKLNSTIDISGSLDEDFTPDLATITGKALAEILTSSLNPENSESLKILGNQLSFIDFNKLDLKKLKTIVSFNNGEINVKPFKVNYKDVPIEISGSHNLSNIIKYKAIFQVPAKYLGNDVNQLVSKINDNDVKNITIPITTNIEGTFSNPKVSTDLTSGVTNLSKQLVEIQKQKLINKGTDKVTSLLGGIINKKKTNTKTDSTTTEDPLKKGVTSILGNIFKKKKKDKDSTNN